MNVLQMQERIVRLESRTEEHGETMNALRESLAGLEDRIDRRMLAAEERIDRRMLATEERIDRRFVTFDDKFDRLSARMSHHFFFLVGLQVTTIAGIVTAILKR